MQKACDIANQTTEQLNSLLLLFQRLPLGNTPLSNISTLLMPSAHPTLIDLEHLKLNLIIKLQQAVILEQIQEPLTPSALKVESAALTLYDQVEDKLPLSQQIVNMKVAITLMDFKIQLTHNQQPKLSMNCLLPLFDELNLWQHYAALTSTHIRYFYLSLSLQYLVEGNTDQAAAVVAELISHLTKCLSSNQQDGEQRQKLLPMLLQTHLCSKYLCKHGQSEQRPQHLQRQIYSLLYELNYELSQQLTYRYKKKLKQPHDQCLVFLQQQMTHLFLSLDLTIIDTLTLSNLPKPPASFKMYQQNSLKQVKRTSLELDKAKKNSTKQLISQKTALKLERQMFVPSKTKGNPQLQRNILIRKERNRSNISLSKITSQSKQTGQKGIKVIDQAPRSLSYEVCKKASLSKNFELQMMICSRPNDFHLRLNSPYPSKDSQATHHRNNRYNKKQSMHFKQSMIIEEERGESILASQRRSSLKVHPSVLSKLLQYLNTLRQMLSFSLTKKKLPVIQFLGSLCLSSSYLYRGHGIAFRKIRHHPLHVEITFSRGDQRWSSNRMMIDYTEAFEMLLCRLERRPTGNVLKGCYLLGKNILLYSLIVAPSAEPKDEIFRVQKISDSTQVYCHTAHINSGKVARCQLKNILWAQEQYIRQLNSSLQIDFNYIHNIPANPKPNSYQPRKPPSLPQLFQPNPKQWLTLYKQCCTLSIHTKYSQLIYNIIQSTTTPQRYLTLDLLFLSPYFHTLYALPLHSRTLPNILNLLTHIRSWNTLQNKLSSSKYLLQQKWHQVKLNRRLLSLPSIKIVSKRQRNGYNIYSYQILVKNQLIIIQSQEQQVKWYVRMNPSELQPNFTSNYLVGRGIKRKQKGSKSCKSAVTLKKFQSKGQLVCESKQQLLQLWRKQQIRHMEVDLAGKIAYLDRQPYRLFLFDYRWTLMVGNKLLMCHLKDRVVSVIKILEERFTYYAGYRLEGGRGREDSYHQFRQLIIREIQSYKSCLPQGNGIVAFSTHTDSIQCSIAQQTQQQRITINKDQLTAFHIQALTLTPPDLRRTSFRKRITKVLRSRYQLLLDSTL